VAQQQQQQQQQHAQDAVMDITALVGLTALQLLQIDLKPLPQQTDLDLNPMPYPMPLQLRFSLAAVQQLAAVWTKLVTLDLSGFGQQLLPAEAVAGFSAFRSLRHLSIMSAEGVLTYGDQGQQQQQQQGRAAHAGFNRKVGWWQLPKGLSSLCISHFDLSSSYDNSSSSSSTEQPCCSCSSCCCMSTLPQDLQQQQQGQQQQQQRQNSPTGFSSRVQQFISPNSSPLKPFAKGRRSQPNQQQHQLGSNAASQQLGRQGLGVSSPTSSSSSEGASSSRTVAGAEVTAAVVAAAVAASSSSSRAAADAVGGLRQLSGPTLEVCSCVARCVHGLLVFCASLHFTLQGCVSLHLGWRSAGYYLAWVAGSSCWVFLHFAGLFPTSPTLQCYDLSTANHKQSQTHMCSCWYACRAASHLSNLLFCACRTASHFSLAALLLEHCRLVCDTLPSKLTRLLFRTCRAASHFSEPSSVVAGAVQAAFFCVTPP
jgi:hypothetical protein